MAIATLYNTPNTPTELDFWAHANMAHHQDIASALQSNGVTIPIYPLNPIPKKDIYIWVYQHQIIHNAQNAALGISGFDLTGVDFNNPDVLEDWIDQHGWEHLRAGEILQIG